MATDAHFGGPPRIPVRTSDRLLGEHTQVVAAAVAAAAPQAAAAPAHHVVGGKFSKRAAAKRMEACIGLASPPHVREKTPPSHPQVRSIDSAMKHFGGSQSAVRKVSRAAASPTTSAQTEHLDNHAVSLPCDAVVIEPAVVHSGAALSAERVGDLQPGEKVVVLEEQEVEGHHRVRLQDERWQNKGWVSRTNNIGRDLLRGPWVASQPSAAGADAGALPSSLTASELASTLGDVRRKLARWAEALPTGDEHDGLPPDVARRRRKADITEAMQAAKTLLRRGRSAVEVLEDVGPTAPSELTDAVQELSAKVGSAVAQKLIHTGRIELASQWSAAVAGWLGALAALVPPLAAVCVDGANTIACVCLSRSNLPDDADSTMIRPLATAASQAVRYSLKALKTLRAQDKVAVSTAPGVDPTAALAARCHLNGCAADGRIGRHRPALEHAMRARKAALAALADAGSKTAANAANSGAEGPSNAEKHSADAAELLVLAWHAAGAQHESLDEPAFCLAAYEKAYAACEKHNMANDSALRSSVRRDLESAQRRFAKNRALTTLEIRRGIEAELGGGGPPAKRKQGKPRRRQRADLIANADADVATGAARAKMQSSMFTGIHKPQKKQVQAQQRPAWDARPAPLESMGNGIARDESKDASAKLLLPTVGPASRQHGVKQKGRGRLDNVPIPGERKLKAEGRAAVREVRGEQGEKAVVIRAAEGSLSLPPIRVC